MVEILVAFLAVLALYTVPAAILGSLFGGGDPTDDDFLGGTGDPMGDV